MTIRFRVNSVNESGTDRVIVTLQSVPTSGTTAPMYVNTLSLNLDSAEANTAGYWPGKEFDVTLAAVTAPA